MGGSRGRPSAWEKPHLSSIPSAAGILGEFFKNVRKRLLSGDLMLFLSNWVFFLIHICGAQPSMISPSFPQNTHSHTHTEVFQQNRIEQSAYRWWCIYSNVCKHPFSIAFSQTLKYWTLSIVFVELQPQTFWYTTFSWSPSLRICCSHNIVGELRPQNAPASVAKCEFNDYPSSLFALFLFGKLLHSNVFYSFPSLQ